MIAIQLTDSGQWLDMLPDSALRYEMVSGAFDMESIQANVVYPFDFPVAGNEEKLNHAHVIAVNRTTKVYDVWVYVNGVMLFQGDLYVKSFNKSIYKGTIIEKNILLPLSDVSIKDLGYSEITDTILLSIAYDAIYKNWPDTPINFPMIYAPKCYGEDNTSNETFDGFVNNYNRAGHFWEQNLMSVDEQPPDNSTAMSPLVYLYEVFKQIQSYFNIKFTGDSYNDSNYHQLLISNMALADKAANSLYCSLFQTATSEKYFPQPGLINDPLLEDWVLWLLEHEDVNNLWDAYNYEISEKGYHIIKASLSVDWTQSDPNEQVVLWIRKGDGENIGACVEVGVDGHVDINYEVEFYAYAGDVGKPLYIVLCVEKAVNTWVQPTTLVSQFEIFNKSTAALNFFDNVIKPGDFLPEITAAGFINQFRLLTGSVAYADHVRKTVEISSLNSLLDSEAIDLTSCMVEDELDLESLEDDSFKLAWDWGSEDRESADVSKFTLSSDVLLFSQLYSSPSFGEVCKVTSDKNFYAHYFDLALITWKLIGDNFTDYVHGDGKTEIPTSISPVRCSSQDNAIFPFINAEFFSKLFNTGSEINTLKLLNWHGMKNDANGLAYPFASSGSYDAEGNVVSDIEIDWNGNKGFYERCWRKWMLFASSQEKVTAKLSVGINEVNQLRNLFLPQPSTKKTRKIRLMNIDFIPEKISVIFTDADTWECEAVLRKKGGETL